ncbi:aminotransferase class III-fold pyridoxal phosphate-dependent enzyme [Sphingomonas baiyangensis]|uniref:Aminotransferase class III-fold pyridoxal phosphate-dependent enzyme n=2 Tax=Sphingomonas baiyangensis TaxID=2572576 RepID=A0A4U1L568_9SPHN|nr:aminotransferase class III-fold pyridoxal phosphate-dependent enzyme [Sphingomonas baiyangensis]
MLTNGGHRLDGGELAELDRRFAFHPFTALADHERNGPPMVVTGGKGAILTDAAGRDYVDAMAGLWCVNVGYGRTEIADAIADQARTLSYCHAFSSMASDKPAMLSARLIEMAPVPMSKVFFGNSGSDANDTQVKLAWYYNNVLGRPAKKKIIARERGYHGVTIVSGGLTGLPGLHAGFDLPLPFIRHAMAPRRLWEGHGLSDAEFVAKLADDLEALIAREGADTIAAFIAEPVQGAGGVIAPPEGYFAAIQPILEKHDILLIADEVICGFGRLGQMFGSSVMGMKPDMMTVAKGLTSAYFPLSGCMVSEKVWRVLAEGGSKFGPFGHGYTYSSHPIGAAAALANLDLLESDALVARAGEVGAYMQERLRAAFGDHPMVGEVRGQALIGAVEFVADRAGPAAFDPALKVAPRVVKAALDRGVIGRALPSADSIAFSPPFVIERAEIDRAVEAFRDAADQVWGELKRDGLV